MYGTNALFCMCAIGMSPSCSIGRHAGVCGFHAKRKNDTVLSKNNNYFHFALYVSTCYEETSGMSDVGCKIPRYVYNRQNNVEAFLLYSEVELG